MNLIFLGTPDFAVPSLKAVLADKKHNVIAVVTQPDKPVGRNAVLTPSPVKLCALENGIKVLQYNKIRFDGVEDIKSLKPDIMVTCAFGQILSQELIDIPKYGIINVHASLLPKYRGAAPIQYAVINGDKETGVTIMQTQSGIDTGDILAVEKIQIDENETAGELFGRLSVLGADLLVRTLDKIEKNDVVPVKQDEEKATHVKMLTKESGKIDWSKSAEVIRNLIRGTNPWPCAFTLLNGKLLKIFSAKVVSDEDFSKNVQDFADCGTVVESNKRLIVKTGDGLLEIKELQLEGGKRMFADAFLLGRKVNKGDVLK